MKIFFKLMILFLLIIISTEIYAYSVDDLDIINSFDIDLNHWDNFTCHISSPIFEIPKVNENNVSNLPPAGAYTIDDILSFPNIYIYNNNDNKIYCYLKDNKTSSVTGIYKWEYRGYINFDSGGNTLTYVYDNDNETWQFVSSISSGSIPHSSASFPDDNLYIIGGNTNIYDYTIKSGNYTGIPNNDYVLYTPEMSINLNPKIEFKVVQTGTRTGNVELIKKNWDSHIYYIKDVKSELERLQNDEILSRTHSRVKYYEGPISIEYGEYVLGLIFDNEGNVVYSNISDSVTLNYDSLLDNTHKLHLDKENEDTYYLSIHGYEERRLCKGI